MVKAMVQQNYWMLMMTTKMNTIYILHHIRHAEKWDKRFSGFLALVTSSSIGGWVIWNQIPIFWTSVIAASHVLTTLKPYFPFAPRLKALPRLLSQLEDLFLELERHWHDVSKGRLTEHEIHELTINIKRKLLKAERDCLGELIIPPNSVFTTLAEEEANKYISAHYLTGRQT